MKHRIAILAADRAELQRALVQLAADSTWTQFDPRVAVRGVAKTATELAPVDIAHTSRAEAERAAALYAQGAALQVEMAQRGRKVALPTYPFEHMRCWVDAAATSPAPPEHAAAPRVHPFLQKRARAAERAEPAE